MINAVLLATVLATNVLVWAPLITDLIDEWRRHRQLDPVPSRRRQRQARRTAAAIRARAGACPEYPATGTVSSGTRTRRVTPAAGVARVTSVAGTHGERAA